LLQPDTNIELAGVIACVAQILNMFSFAKKKNPSDSDVADSALIFFVFALTTLVLCIVAFLGLLRLPLYQYYTEQAEINAAASKAACVRSDEENDTDSTSSNVHPPSFRMAVRQIAPMALTAILNCMITLSLFPNMASFVHSSQESCGTLLFEKKLFTPFVFLLFNLGDWFGRMLVGVRWFNITNTKFIVLGNIARLGFFPLFLFSRLDFGSGVKLSAISYDSIFLPTIFLFALSGGYFSTLCMTAAPRMADTSNRGLASSVMIFCLNAGLAFGTTLAWGVVAVSCGCSPFSL